MPVFRVQVNYQRGTTGKWSNVWHVNAADITTASDAVAGFMVPDLLPLLDNSAQIVSTLISDEASTQFVTTPVGANGTSTASGDLLPLYNSAKVFFSDGSLGRPDYKYFKGFVTESIQTNGDLTSGAIGVLETRMTTLIADMDANGAPLVSTDNDPYASASAQTAVQMRQMHRKRKKAAPAP